MALESNCEINKTQEILGEKGFPFYLTTKHVECEYLKHSWVLQVQQHKHIVLREEESRT